MVFLTQTGRAAVAFTVTPAAVSNTYSGTITLQVSGLTNNGDTVVIQKFFDSNTNGVIDAGDLLGQQFNLTDGQAGMVIAGVTNINVLGDTDGTANGQIMAKLNFQADFSQSIAARYLFKLSSPAGLFTAITNSFTVTNYPYAQQFTGTVVSAGVAVPNAAILVFPANQNGNPVGGAVANNAGNYVLPVAAGTYSMIAFKSNYVAGFYGAANLVLSNGATFKTNLNLIATTQSISGKIVDAGNSSLGLPDLLVPVTTPDRSLLGIGFSDTNGNFTVRVNSNLWAVEVNSGGLTLHGYLGLQNKTGVATTNGSVSGVTISLPRATALIYGNITDNLGNPLVGLDVYASDNNGLYQADAYTDTNGYYVLGVLGMGLNDQWHVQANGNNQITNKLFSQETINNNINAGQALSQNFTSIIATNQITGHVQDSDGNPISFVGVSANATISNATYQSYVDTDVNGNYSLNVANGEWFPSVNCNGGSDSLDNILGSGNYQCPGNLDLIISNANGTANFTVQLCNGIQIITPSSLPAGEVNVNYDQFLQASSCNSSFTWSTNSGTLPPGLQLTTTGEIYGIPYTNGTFNFSINVADGSGFFTNQSFSLEIATNSFQTMTLSTLYSFTNGVDGANPYAGLVQGNDGSFYGTTAYGGASGSGTVFKISTNGIFTALYSFTGGSDGAFPYARLLLANDGCFYGTTASVGGSAYGHVFKMTSNGVLTNLYSFTGGSDGGYPLGALIQGVNGKLYGTTATIGSGGGGNNGTIFAITTNGSFNTLYAFSGGNDGDDPEAGLLLGQDGAFYGTTTSGGTNGNGTIFKISTNAPLVTLYSFTGGADGANPYASPVQGSDGSLYGVAASGGGGQNGTVFQLTTNRVFNNLSFGGNNGADPEGALVAGSGGAFYATTVSGGVFGNGVVFSADTNGALTALYSFYGTGDGANPHDGLAVDGAGNFYGTTSQGGINNAGTVFRLSFSSGPSPDLAPISILGPAPIVSSQPNPTTTLVWGVTNLGVGVAQGLWIDRVWFSTNGLLDSQSISVGEFPVNQTVPSGGSYWLTNAVALPLTASGNYTLFVQVDAYNQIHESSLANNTSAGASGTFTLQPPDLALAYFLAPSVVSSGQPNPVISVVWGVTNQGIGTAPGGWYDTVWFSTNGLLDSNSLNIGNFYNYQSLPAGGSYNVTNSVSLPISASGNYTLFVQVDTYNDVYELNKSNNISAGSPGLFTLGSAPDLAPTSFIAVTNNVVFYPNSPQSPTVQVAWAVTNQGAAPAAGYWYDRVYVSTNTTIAGAISSSYVWEYWSTNYGTAPLPAGGQYQQINTVTLPQQSGTYYLILSANDGQYLYETNYANNVSAAVPITVTYQVQAPDLAPTSFTAASNNVVFYPNSPQSPTVQVTWAVTNQGIWPAAGYWYDRVYVSTNATIAGAISSTYFGESWSTNYGTASLPAGGQYQQTNNVALPEQSGTYYLILSANDGQNLYEANYANNLAAAVPIMVTYQVQAPDLAPTLFTAATNNVVFYPSSPQSPTVQVTWAVTNQGAAPAAGYWYDRVYVSTNTTIAGAISSSYVWEYWSTNYGTASLPVGGQYPQTNNVALPQQSGTYYLILSANDGQNLYEANYANNVAAAVPITVTYQVRAPDLAPIAFAAATNSVVFYPSSPQPPTVQVTWAVTNQGIWPAAGYWYDLVCVSTNSTLAGAISFAYFGESWSTNYGTAPLPAGGQYQQTNNVALPEQSGTYYLILSANDGQNLYEANYANNVAAAVPIQVTYQVRPPDLAALAVIAPSNVASAYPYPPIQVIWGVTNQGPGMAGGGWYDRVWFSTNGIFDGQTEDIGDFYISQPVAPGGAYRQTNTVFLPLAASQSYTLFVQADADNFLYEFNKSNNLSAGVIGMFSLTPIWSVSATNNPLAGGSISGTGSYVSGTSNSLTAFPYFGYYFGNWTEGTNVVGTNQTLTLVVLTNHNFAANYREMNPTHVVTTTTSPGGLAVVLGAGTYINGQTANFSSPLFITNPPSLYTFQQYTLSNQVVSAGASFSKTFSTIDPGTLQYVAAYTSSPLLPVLVRTSLNLGNPVPATTDFLITLQFDRSMQTNIPPGLELTNVASVLQPAVLTNGIWTASAFSNDTYSVPPITFISGMDGTNQIYVSGARDLAGNVLALTNVGSILVDATPPSGVVLSETASNSSSVTVSWTGYGAPADLGQFRAFLETTNFNSVVGLPVLTSLSAGTRSFQFNGLSLDTPYFVTIQAVDLAGNGSSVNILPISLPETIPPPVSVQVTPLGANSVVLSWNGYSTSSLVGFAGFKLYYAPQNFSTVPGTLTNVRLTPSTHSYEVDGLDRTKTYYFAVVGFNQTNGFNSTVTTSTWSDPYAGNIAVNTTIGGGGQNLVNVYQNIFVVSNATLTVQPGTTLLFAPGNGLTVQQGTLVANGTALAPIIFDSANDSPGLTPAAGDWAGVTLGSGAGASSLNFVEILYGSGLNISGCSPAVYAFTAMNNTPSGLGLQNGATLNTSAALLTANRIGALQSDTSALTMQNSVIQNNGTNAVALGNVAMNGASNWWGITVETNLTSHLHGNVTYNPFLTYEPVLTPAIGALNGVSQVGIDAVGLQLACRTAESMRLSEDYTFTGVFFTPFTNSYTFPLSPGGGLKRVYVQYRSVTGQTNTPLELDVNYVTGGPIIQSFSLSQGQILNRPLTVTASATSVLGMADMEFYVDGMLLGTNAGGNLSQYFDIRTLGNAVHQVELLARDTSGNVATLQNLVAIAVTPPVAPVITLPAVDLLTNTNVIAVAGTAEPGINIQLTRNGQVIGQTNADSTGNFMMPAATLVEGDNLLLAVASDGTGTTPSAARHVTVETMPPAALVMNQPVYSPGTGLTLSWTFPPTGKLASTYQLFWSTFSFATTNQATGHSIILSSMSDTVQGLADGTYYFGVVGYDAAGVPGPVSALVSTVYHATPPAMAVSYSHPSPVGLGPLNILLTASEALLTAPALTLQPYGAGSPILLSLTNVAVNTWQTSFPVISTTPSGPVALSVSAQDLFGNVFSGVPTGPALVIDLVPPAASITTVPPAPVQTTNNVFTGVNLVMTKPAGPGSTPALSFTPPSGTNVPILLSGSGTNWSGALTLTPSMGSGYGQFFFSAQDGVGNLGSNVLSGGLLELYNTTLPPPPPAPLGLSAMSLPGGQISLNWNSVSNAQIYRLYREPGTNLVAPAVLVADNLISNSITDLPPVDGPYRYGVTASRLGSESGISNVVVALSDRTPPPTPTNIVVTLAASGVQVTWQEPSGGATPDHYNIYRNGAIIATSGNITPVVDYPPHGTNIYFVGAADLIGNESRSVPVSLQLPVGPVSNLAVLVNSGQAPVLSWVSGDPAATGFNVYRNGILQNASPWTATNYVDNLPLSDAVTYAVTAMNNSAQQSPPRLVNVCPVALGLVVNPINNPILVNYFDQYQLAITNLSSSTGLPLTQWVLNRSVNGVSPLIITQSLLTAVSAGTNLQPTLIVPEAPVAAAQHVQVSVFQQTDSEGSSVVYENSFAFSNARLPGVEISVATSQLPLAGGLSTFQAQINNASSVPIEIVTARGNGAKPGDLYIAVQNSYGQAASQTSFLGTPPGTTFLPDGRAYVQINPGASVSLTVSNVLVPVALAGSTNTTFEAVVTNIYSQIGTANEAESGPLSGSMVSSSLAAPPYNGTAQTDRSVYANDQPIIISGQAISTSTGLPVPNVPLNIGFATRGYDWFQPVMTDTNGNYQYTYNPVTGFASTLSIWAANPQVVDQLNQASVTVYRAYFSPDSGEVEMSKNGTIDFNIQLINPGNVPLTGFAASCTAYQVSGTSLTPISTLTGNSLTRPGFSIAPNQSQTVTLQLAAAINAPSTVEAVFTFTSAEGAIATLTLSVSLLPAVPVINVVAPATGYVEANVNRGDQVSSQVTIVNNGLTTLKGITLQPPTNVTWMQINLPVSTNGLVQLADLPEGQSNTFTVVFTPPASTPLAQYQDDLIIQGTNLTLPFQINLYAIVTSDQTGSAQFQVEDFLGDYLDGASVRLQNNLLQTSAGPFMTDSNGLVTITNLEEGVWNWQASAPGCSPASGTVTITADQTTYQNPILVRSLVTINFTVVPVPFTDQYEIQVDQTFATHVPVPELVMTPPTMNFNNVTPGFQGTFNVQVQNAGLVKLSDITINGQQTSRGTLTPLITYIPVLMPQQSVEIPFVATYSGANAPAQQANVFTDCIPSGPDAELIAGALMGFNAIAQGLGDCPISATVVRVVGVVAVTYYLFSSVAELVSTVTGPIKETIGSYLGCVIGTSLNPDGGGAVGLVEGYGYVPIGGGCFAPDTTVLMADGTFKPISKVRTNEIVRSGSRADNLGKVSAVYVMDSSSLEEIDLTNLVGNSTSSNMLTTPEHLFWVDGQGWKFADGLRIGDWLFDSNDHRVQISGIKMIHADGKVYTLKLAGASSFYANNILVHDLCGSPPVFQATRRKVAP